MFSKLNHHAALNSVTSLLRSLNKPHKEVGQVAEKATEEASRFSENRHLPLRAAVRPVFYYFYKARVIWNSLAIAFVLDLLLLGGYGDLPFSQTSLDKLYLLSYLSLAIAVLGLFRDKILHSLHSARFHYDNLVKRTQSYSLLGIGLILLVSSFELITHMGQFGVYVLLGVIVVAIRSFTFARKSLSEQKQKRAAIQRDKTLLIDLLNQELFITNTLPFVAARLSGLGFSLIAMHNNLPSSSIVEVATSALLFFVLLPKPDDFVANCQRCARWTSKRLALYGYCPYCGREQFQIKSQ